MPTALRKIYQLKIELRNSKPPIWRRFLIDNTTLLPELHKAMQIIMGWPNDRHSHQFIAKNKCYSIPTRGLDFPGITDEKKCRVDQILKKESETFIYEYDFGYSWTHRVTLEKILPFELNSKLPLCIKAKGACPPDDKHGNWRYFNSLEVLQDSSHPAHEAFKDYITDHYNASTYNIDEVNKLLSKHDR